MPSSWLYEEKTSIGNCSVHKPTGNGPIEWTKEPSGTGTTGFVQSEIERIAVALREPQPPKRYVELYAAQQALSWALDPDNLASPLTMVLEGRGAATGSQGD